MMLEVRRKEFNTSTGWFNNLRKRFGLKNVKVVGEAALANQEASNQFPNVFNAEKTVFLRKKMLQ